MSSSTHRHNILFHAYLNEIEAPVTGTYRLHIAAQNNASIGEYRLWWQNLSDIPTPLPASPTPVRTLTPFPSPIPPAGSIPNFVSLSESYFYIIQANALQDVNIAVLGRDGFDPVLRVWDPLGKLVIEEDDTGGSQDPRVSFIAEPSGLYTIEIFGFDGTAGAFTMSYIVQ